MSDPNTYAGYHSPPSQTPGYLVASILMLFFGAAGMYWVTLGEPLWNTPWPYLVSVVGMMLLIWAPFVFITWIGLVSRDRRNRQWKEPATVDRIGRPIQ